ncbi:MAG: histidine ammonia-lyase [Gemmatimonadota bacterium]|nr:histidine ammonia-lyase [Gemmatimonadota bacterium]
MSERVELSTSPIRIGALHQDLERSLASLRADPSRVHASRAVVERALGDGGVYYGINTGFGVLADQRIPADQLERLQRNLVLSHAVGVGAPVPREITRLMLGFKLHALGLGFSGVSAETFDRLLRFWELDLVPVVPSRGSVGASGDLAPLAHLALPLLGEGSFWSEDGGVLPARSALQAHGMEPIALRAKDGLALINGTQMMSAYGACVLGRALRLERTADLLAAMSLEALQGSARPFDPRIHQLRPHPGQAAAAANVRALLVGSEILESHRNCGKVQDPYCLRCVPQVHGAARDSLTHARRVTETEINSVTDNPLVFPDGDIVSGGNFHGEPLAFVLDLAAMALAELASISERRTYLLLEGHDGLPRLLMRETGINSGFMIPQYTSAALVSENKVLCHPASVDSIPTSVGQEDHVSMGSVSALKLLQVLENTEHVLAIELLTAAQALDFRLPLRPGRGVEIAHASLRERIPHREADEAFGDVLGHCTALVRGGELVDAVAGELGALV